MGMSMGMMGALGAQGNGTGLGGALMHEAGVMEREEVANADMARRTKLEQWLMQAREEINIRAEGRAEERAVRTDDRNWKNEQDRAPVKTKMKVDENTAEAKGKLDFESGNIDTIAGNKKKVTEASRTDAQNAEDKAKARYWEANATDLETNGKPGKGGGVDKSGTKLEPDDEMEYKSLDARVKSLQGVIDKARGEPGGWDPEKNPGQKQLQTELSATQLRQRAILAQYRDGASDDPLSIRKGRKPAGMAGIPEPDGKTADGKPYVMKSPRKAEPSPQSLDVSISPESGAITKADIDNIKDPQERANLRLALTNKQAPMSPAGAPPAARPTPPAGSGSPMPMSPPADRANPLAVMRSNNQAIDAERVNDRPTNEEAGELRTAEAEQRDAFVKGVDMKPYEEKVKSLRQRIAERVKREREQRAAGL